MANVVIFGDSIASGAWDSEGGWAIRVQRYLFEKVMQSNYADYWEVHNLSISGATTRDTLERFDREFAPRDFLEGVLIFALGTNDSQVLVDTKQTLLSVDEYASNLSTLFEKGKVGISKVLFVNAPPVDEAKVNPMPWLLSAGYVNEQIEEFNAVAADVCFKHDVKLLNVWQSFEAAIAQEGSGVLLADGVHPTDRGHKIIFEAVVKEFV